MPNSLFPIPWEKMISFSLRKQTALQNKKLQHMMRLYAGHDLLHLQQIERIKSAVLRRR